MIFLFQIIQIIEIPNNKHWILFYIEIITLRSRKAWLTNISWISNRTTRTRRTY